jgi:hypothetical protein
MGCLYQPRIIINMGCFIYLHKRLDNNEIFYIGRGTVSKKASGKCDTNTYSRAYVKHVHKRYWMRIVDKYPWSVEILEDNLTWDESLKLEIKYIKEYGRKDLNEGTLVNFTDGGEGSKNIIVSDNIRLTQKNRMSSESNPMKRQHNKLKQSDRMKENNPMKNPEILKKVSDSMKLVWADESKTHPRQGKPREDLRIRNLTNNPMKNPETIEKIRQIALNRDNKGGKSPNSKKVQDTTTGIIYSSVIECADGMGISRTSIYRYFKKGKVVYL